MPFPNKHYSGTHPENLARGLEEIGTKLMAWDANAANYILQAAKDVGLLGKVAAKLR